MLYNTPPSFINFRTVKIPDLKEVEIKLKRRNPQIFEDFTPLQIRNAIELVLNEAKFVVSIFFILV